MVLLPERLTRWLTAAFPWMWKLAVLALPWQTRWFQEGPWIAGYPWEQGRISVYASWIPTLLVIGIDAVLGRAETKTHTREALVRWVGVGLFLIWALVTTSALRSTIQWVIEIAVLLLFFRTLFARVSVREFLRWSIFSLIPHALLGIWQAIDQRVIGHTLLGIASQQPITPGVAVIETGGIRWLRSYGGFSHPNIFGGWLVFGILSILAIAKEQIERRKKMMGLALLALFSVALVLSYSRSAWIALCIGSLVWFVVAPSALPTVERTRRFKRMLPSILIVLVSVGAAVMARPSLVFSRAQVTTRLEQKSLSERARGIENAFRIFRERPFAGSGLGANAWLLGRLDQAEGRPSSIPITPHNVPLLALAELGAVGLLLGAIGGFFSLRSRRKGPETTIFTRLRGATPLLFLLPLLMLDHYLWSYWSGKALFLTAFSLYFLDE